MSLAEPILIFETVHGSRAYDLHSSDSDTDVKGIVVGPAAWYLGYLAAPEQTELSPDHTRYEIRKFFRLASATNPTVLELLWISPRHHLVVSPEGQRLLDSRRLFLSRQVEQTFGGYALAQLQRIRTHRRWLLEPPAEEPTRAAFGLPERTLVPKDQLGAAESMLADGRLERVDLSTNFLEVLERERRYRAARKEFEQYRRWVQLRNPERAALERAHGYDTKHALHLIRLLRMGVEILETGNVIVERPDREELLAVRDGCWSYDELIVQAEALRDRMAEARSRSSLPERVDEEKVNSLCVELTTSALGRPS